MKKFVIVLLAVLVTVLGFAAPAQAARVVAGPTITLDANGTGLDLRPTATDLSKRTGVSVVVGSCDGGQYCIEFSKDQCSGYTTGGCAWATDTGCHVSIMSVAYNFDYWFTVYVTTHEVVHCLTWIGGAGFFHVDDRPSILNATGCLCTMRENQTKINAKDREMISAIFAGTP